MNTHRHIYTQTQTYTLAKNDTLSHEAATSKIFLGEP